MVSSTQSSEVDLEKRAATEVTQTVEGDEKATQPQSAGEVSNVSWLKRVAMYGVETRGVQPVPIEERTDKRSINLFFIWWTSSVNLLPVTTGLVGTLFNGLSLQAACLTILFFTVFGCIPPAAFCTLGPSTGLRQLVQARYSFGLYFVTIAAILILATTTGWSIVATIVAGQTLSAVSGGSLNWALGIVIISILALAIAFMGYKVVHTYERYAWIPALIAIIIVVGCGGHLLSEQAPTEPAQASTVLSFGCIVTSFSMTWATMASDFCVYMEPSTPKVRLFAYTYFGLMLPTVPLMCLGAAIGGAIPSVESLAVAYDLGATGGAMMEMASNTGGFARFLAVLLAFSLLGNIAGTMYAITIQCQILLPIFSRVPRYVFAIVITGVIIAVAIPISHNLELSLENFLGVIAYWAAVFIGVVSTEYLYFRKGDTSSFDHSIWNVGSKLPLGLAAILACAVPFALIIPSMATSWYIGPIGMITGDIGFEVGLVLSVLCYLPFRTLELRMTGR